MSASPSTPSASREPATGPAAAGYKLCPQCRQIYPARVESCPRDQARLIVDKRILVGKYILLNRIGSGYRSEVYAAEQPQLGRMVAIKLLQCDPAVLSSFDREVRSVGNVKHEHVVTLYDSGLVEDGRPYIAMEYLEGEDLARCLARSGPMSGQRALPLWRQAVSAIAAAHRRSIVHGDIKPSNLFLTHREREYGTEEIAKVIDFAIASQTARHDGDSPPRGSRYVAPEQAASGASTLRSDVYSLGLLLLYMLTGQVSAEPDDRAESSGPAGQARTLGQTLLHKLESAPQNGKALSQLRLSPELKELLGETLHPDPARRPADAGELLQRLRQLSADVLPGGTANGPVASAPLRQDRLISTRPDWPTSAKSPKDKRSDVRPAPGKRSSADGLPKPASPEGNQTPQMGVAMLTDLLHQLKDKEQDHARSHARDSEQDPERDHEQDKSRELSSAPVPQQRRSAALRLTVTVLVPALLGGLLALLIRASGVGSGAPPPPGTSFVAAGRSSAPPAAPVGRPEPAASAVVDLGSSPEPRDLLLPSAHIDLSVAPAADGAETADEVKALKVRFVYDDGELTALQCTPESQAAPPATDKHGSVVEALVRPGGSCRASGPNGSRTYKYDGLAQKRPDASGYRRVHVRLSEAGDAAPASATRRSAEPKPIPRLPKPPTPESDGGS